MADAASIRQRLLERAFLYDDPACYSAGVLDAIEELSRSGGAAATPEQRRAATDPRLREPVVRRPA